VCLRGHPIEFFRICLPPRGKCLRKELPLTEQNVSPSQLSTIRPKCRKKTPAGWRTPRVIPSHDLRKERLCSSPVGTQRTMMMYLMHNHAKLQRQSRMPKWDRPNIRHAIATARPNGQRTQRTWKKARPSILQPKSPIARPASGAPHLPILPGERRNVREPQETHQEAF